MQGSGRQRPIVDVFFAKGASIQYGSQVAGYPGSQKRKACMSFNDLAKKEAADKKASQEEDPKSQTGTDEAPESESELGDPSIS
ncbi:hypothetical protein KX928_10660 [Roseobacter sp. YSTF-M11]|uniref:Uncharacterized protein n=1 Tax=Roseobacter insulae TaxID=2859783 RepID=A0A9X1FUM5_9RHOB|nr:hypothetical protein [Roseobacter insulae]MBW4708245.1 hypothetical protein [Roseobacter insulae]